jgi:imidazolonepropionase-like amidohydrolase
MAPCVARVHGISHGAVRAALGAGVDGFVHSCFADSAPGEMMRSRGVPIIPTAASFEPLRETEAGRALFATMRQRIAQGVPIVFGTDAGVLPHGNQCRRVPGAAAARGLAARWTALGHDTGRRVPGAE